MKLSSAPDILLLVTDQFRYDAFDPRITPNLYKLSLESTTFLNAYSSTPTCTPSRAALLTGKSPWNHGMLGYAFSVDCQKYPSTLPSVLHELLGYETYSAGKNHFGKNGTQWIDHGYQHMKIYDGIPEFFDDYSADFDHLFPGMDPMNSTSCHDPILDWNTWRSCPYSYPENVHPTPWTTRKALEFLEHHTQKKNSSPIFLKVSYQRPHSPYDPPNRLLQKYLNHLPIDRFVNNTSWDKKFLNLTEMPSSAWHGDPGQEAARHSRAGYLASCEFVDEGVGEIIDWLQQNKRFENLLIIWTSDHGDMNGDHNLWRKGYAYEASSHIPLIIRLPAKLNPDQQTIRQSDALVENRDIPVTIYDVLNILDEVKRRDPLVNGQSLWNIITGKEESVRSWLDLEHSEVYDERIHWNAILAFNEQKLWKYIFHVKGSEEQLFCLSSDPHESYDLSTEQESQNVLDDLRQTMILQFREEQRGTVWIKDGKLVKDRKAFTFGDHYPCLKAIAIRPM